jgi:DNA-binding beta-propeller fold protein YncE
MRSKLRVRVIVVLVGVMFALEAGVAVAGPLELLVASRGNNQVLRYDAMTGDFIDVFVSGGALDDPSGLAQGANGDIFVANFGNGRVPRYGWPAGEHLGTLSHGDLEETVSVAVDNGFVYALANDTHRMGVFDEATGQHLYNFGNPTMRYAHDFTIGPDGLLYVTTEAYPGNRVQAWDPKTRTLVRDFGPNTDLPLPVGLAFGPDGYLYVADWSAREILRYDSQTGDMLGVFATLSSAPVNIAFGPHDGNLYVTAGDILRYDGTTGEFIDVFIEEGGALDYPRGMLFIPEPTTAMFVFFGAFALIRRRK